MAKLRLVGWLVLCAAVGWWCLGGLAWPAEPAAQAMAVVRALAGVLAAYLVVVTVAAVRAPRLAPRFVRRLVAGAVGSALLVAPMTASAAPGDEGRAPVETPVLRRLDAEPPNRVGSAGPAPADPTQFVTVAAGDHLWAIAERVLSERLGREPDDAEVAPFWTELVAANEGRLASGDPDLVFPGETIRLPS